MRSNSKIEKSSLRCGCGYEWERHGYAYDTSKIRIGRINKAFIKIYGHVQSCPKCNMSTNVQITKHWEKQDGTEA